MRHLLILILFTVCFSCTEKTNNSEEVKTLKVLDAPTDDFEFESVKLVPLQIGENFYLGEW